MSWFKSKIKWDALESSEQFDELRESASFFIFKHSTRCSISSLAKSRLEVMDDLKYPIVYLDLLNFRNISALVEEKLSVEHQSPQLILVNNGKAKGVLSHNAISWDNVKALESSI